MLGIHSELDSRMHNILNKAMKISSSFGQCMLIVESIVSLPKLEDCKLRGVVSQIQELLAEVRPNIVACRSHWGNQCSNPVAHKHLV